MYINLKGSRDEFNNIVNIYTRALISDLTPENVKLSFIFDLDDTRVPDYIQIFKNTNETVSLVLVANEYHSFPLKSYNSHYIGDFTFDEMLVPNVFSILGGKVTEITMTDGETFGINYMIVD